MYYYMSELTPFQKVSNIIGSKPNTLIAVFFIILLITYNMINVRSAEEEQEKENSNSRGKKDVVGSGFTSLVNFFRDIGVIMLILIGLAYCFNLFNEWTSSKGSMNTALLSAVLVFSSIYWGIARAYYNDVSKRVREDKMKGYNITSYASLGMMFSILFVIAWPYVKSGFISKPS